MRSFCWTLSEHLILWSLCSLDFHNLTLQLHIQNKGEDVFEEIIPFVNGWYWWKYKIQWRQGVHQRRGDTSEKGTCLQQNSWGDDVVEIVASYDSWDCFSSYIYDVKASPVEE